MSSCTDLVRIWLADLCAHLRQNPLLAYRCRPRVLNLQGTNDGGSRGRLRSLCPGKYSAKECAYGGYPKRKRQGAHPSTKTFHRSRSAAPRKTNPRRTGGYIGNKMAIVKARFFHEVRRCNCSAMHLAAADEMRCMRISLFLRKGKMKHRAFHRCLRFCQ